MTAHQCDDECVCPLDGKPLIYWPAGNQHACQDPDCPNAHGVLPELTAEDAVEAMQDMAGDLHTAQDRLAFVREMCDLADREQRQPTTEQIRAWLAYTGCGRAIELTEAELAALHKATGDAISAKQAERWKARGWCGICGFNGDRSGCQDCDGGKR